MRIGLIANSMGWGGSEIHTVQLTRVLTELGHRVVLAAFNDTTVRLYRERAGLEMDIVDLRLGASSSRPSCASAISSLKPLQCDTLVLVKGWHLSGGIALDVAARLCSRRYVVIEHLRALALQKTSRRYLGGLLPGLGLWWYERVITGLVRSALAHNTVCVSGAVKARLVEDYRIPEKRFVVVPNGVDTDRYAPSPELRRAQRKAWGIADDALVFGAAGRLGRSKRFDIVIDAVARMEQEHPGRDIRLVLAGEGSEKEALRAQAAAVLRSPAVFPGYIERSWEFMPGLDVFTLASEEEGLPLALLEAMACGCGAVATAVGGVPEALSGVEHGWLVEPGQPHLFEAGMRAALALTAEERNEMGRRNRERVMAHFNGVRQFRVLADLLTDEGRRSAPQAGRMDRTWAGGRG